MFVVNVGPVNLQLSSSVHNPLLTLLIVIFSWLFFTEYFGHMPHSTLTCFYFFLKRNLFCHCLLFVYFSHLYPKTLSFFKCFTWENVSLLHTHLILSFLYPYFFFPVCMVFDQTEGLSPHREQHLVDLSEWSVTKKLMVNNSSWYNFITQKEPKLDRRRTFSSKVLRVIIRRVIISFYPCLFWLLI